MYIFENSTYKWKEGEAEVQRPDQNTGYRMMKCSFYLFLYTHFFSIYFKMHDRELFSIFDLERNKDQRVLIIFIFSIFLFLRKLSLVE